MCYSQILECRRLLRVTTEQKGYEEEKIVVNIVIESRVSVSSKYYQNHIQKHE